MSGYGHDESAPTPGGLFATNFVGGRGELRIVRNQFRRWTWGIAECFATNFVVDVGN